MLSSLNKVVIVIIIIIIIIIVTIISLCGGLLPYITDMYVSQCL